ncbi:hypothetical protein NH26_01760 [Flammeovirga pacifica]|uniref:Secretion system C-terminal sorting domain-containing protein n=2 Tax=Flammeovirga pacifica TaxID=915059 RepID=A0A1S1YVW2_FLAPC|nr:hypothetical protein NH26_01760 [Flammeovirga pacifica]
MHTNIYSATINWTASGDGNWSDGANWSSGSVPDENDDITIDCGCTVTATSDINIGGSLTVTSGSTLDLDNLYDLTPSQNDATITNYGTIHNVVDLKSNHDDIVVHNYGFLSVQKLEDKHDDHSAIYNNYTGGEIEVTVKIHFHGTFNNLGLLNADTSDKFDLHGATFTGGGEIIANNIKIHKEGTSYARVEDMKFTTSNGCNDGETVTFNLLEYDDVKSADNGTDGFSFDQDNVFICGTNAVGVDLPVELVFFKGKISDSKNILYWETASEENNSHFSIEQSTDKLSWNTIGEVNGSGNSKSTIEYSFNIDEPLQGVIHYRLKQVDFDGEFVYFGPVSLLNSRSTKTNELTVFPNPATTHFNISSPSMEIEVNQVQLFNSHGINITNKVNFESIGKNQISVVYDGLERGFYFINVNGTTTKILVN